MLDRECIRKTEEFLKEKFNAGAYLNLHQDEKNYRFEHTYRVANIGRQIAAEEGFDETEMVIACLLHDVSYCEEFGEDGWIEHGRRSAKIARPFLRELGIPADRADDICYGIAIHVDDEADFEGERTAFAQSVGDADNIDRLDVYRIHESLCADGFLEKSYDAKRAYVEDRIARLKQFREIRMSTKTAEDLWRERLDFGMAFFGKLAEQLENSAAVTD